MSTMLRTILFCLLLCGSLVAAPVSKDYLCVQGHEQDATAKLQTLIKDAIARFFQDRNIAINSSSLQVTLTMSTLPGTNTPPYVSFTGNPNNSAAGASSVAATVTAQDGTKFTALLSSGSDNQNAAEYLAMRTQRGFDKEGNAVDEHCTLKLFNAGDTMATENLLIVNANSGHTVGLTHLPRQFSLY